jgi:CRISPR-associated protein Csx17
MTESNPVTQILPGLRPEPLASYLAGLGLFRLLAEQADPAATVAWTADGLAISTTVADIAGWLVDQYVPTPVLSPWNNGSGFGLKDKEPKRTLDALRDHPSPRLEPFRDAIPIAEQASATARSEGWLTDAGKSGDKARAVQEFRNRCPEAILPWIDASVVLSGDGAVFPPLLGTGGNDGRLDFSTNFHQRVLDVLDATGAGRERSLGSARDVLAGVETQPLADAAIGQFDPGRAGGPGSSRFGAADSRVNPWQYVLLVEGAMLFAATVVRRGQHDVGRAAMPFTVYSSADGSTSGAADEETRGEIWVPVWEHPFTLSEIRQLFGEARASWRGKPARRAVEFYEATRTFGTSRGIDSFVRYGLHRRNGLAYAAVPLDRPDTRPDSSVRLLADLEEWARHLRSDPSSTFVGMLRQFENAQLAYARTGEPIELAKVLAALTALEQAVGRSARARENVPVRRPRPAGLFVEVFAREMCSELRIAAGMASCATVSGPNRQPPARTMRQILLPLDPRGAADPARVAGHWRGSPLVPGLGLRPLPHVLASVLAWRSRTAADEPDRGEVRGVVTFRSGVRVPAVDLHALASGQLNIAKLEFWLRACLALDWRGVGQLPAPDDKAAFLLVPALGLLQPFASGISTDRGDVHAATFGLKPDWAARLAVGQVDTVHDEVVARLRLVGWTAAVSPSVGVTQRLRPEEGVLIASALVPRCLNRLGALAKLAIQTPGTRGDGSDIAVVSVPDSDNPEHEQDLITTG